MGFVGVFVVALLELVSEARVGWPTGRDLLSHRFFDYETLEVATPCREPMLALLDALSRLPIRDRLRESRSQLETLNPVRPVFSARLICCLGL
jgi:hypothetical protein